LDEAARVQRFDQVAELGLFRGFEAASEQRGVALRGSARAEEQTFRALKVRRDMGSRGAPKHE
jgi:hypothetical protein